MKQALTAAAVDLHRLDEIARRDSPIHRLHPLAKLGVTLVYLCVVTSSAADAIGRLFPFLLYPVLLLSLADLPVLPFVRRVLLVEPLLLGIGLLNPVFDRQMVMIGNLAVAHGWLTLLAILVKGGLTILAVLLLMAITGFNQLAGALRQMRVPRLFVTVFLLIFRYLTVLAEEASRMQRAYAMRAPRHPGIRPRAWGSLAGQLLLRSVNRADRVHQAMILRGFTGDFPLNRTLQLKWPDLAWLVCWTVYLLLVRLIDLPLILGSLLTGGLS